MGVTPSTIFAILMFPLIFAVCIVWATHGHPANADNEGSVGGSQGSLSGRIGRGFGMLPVWEGARLSLSVSDNESGSWGLFLTGVTGAIIMAGTPNTIGLILLFIAVFFACILWATHGHTATSDPEEEDVGTPGKTS